MQFFSRKFSLNMFTYSLKGKFSRCPTQLIHPKRASVKDNILSYAIDIYNNEQMNNLTLKVFSKQIYLLKNIKKEN